MATAAVGTHPTGMHSYYFNFLNFERSHQSEILHSLSFHLVLSGSVMFNATVVSANKGKRQSLNSDISNVNQEQRQSCHVTTGNELFTAE